MTTTERGSIEMEEVCRQAQVAQQEERLYKAVEELEAVVPVLEERLGRVATNEPLSPDPQETTATEEILVPLADTLRSNGRRVLVSAHRLQNLTERIEL